MIFLALLHRAFADFLKYILILISSACYGLLVFVSVVADGLPIFVGVVAYHLSIVVGNLAYHLSRFFNGILIVFRPVHAGIHHVLLVHCCAKLDF